MQSQPRARVARFVRRASLVIVGAVSAAVLLLGPGSVHASPDGPAPASDPRVEMLARAEANGDKESLPLVRAPRANAAGFTGAGTSVAVLDTGVDWRRGAFGPCTAVAMPAKVCRVIVSADVLTNDGQLDDPNILHGTNVAGIVASVAPGTKIIALDVFDRGAQTSDTAVLAALDWVMKNKQTYNIVAVNMSLRAARSYNTTACGASTYGSVFLSLRQAGILPVVSAGNSGIAGGRFTNGIFSPACVTGAVSVGAVYDANIGGRSWGRGADGCTDNKSKADQITCFSQSGPNLSLLAPGAIIRAAEVDQGGTSQAAPHVAGAVAALSSACRRATPAQIEQALVTTGPTIKDARNGIARHRLDVLAAGQALKAQALCR
ncbi:MAG: S8 family serine peptidase [Chloroflexi bacterium]|nr:S8 family serine peptidase [Chloroflexota bacterium]